MKEIDKKGCRKNIIAYLRGRGEKEDECREPIYYFHRMVSLFREINEIQGYSHQITYQFYCDDNKKCCVFVKEACSCRIAPPQFQINDIENIEELTNATYYLLLDAGIIDMFC